MIEGQKIALLIFTMLIGVGGLVLRNYLYGTFDMGSKVGTIGLIAIFSAFLLGSSLSALYPETVQTLVAVFRGIDAFTYGPCCAMPTPNDRRQVETQVRMSEGPVGIRP